MIIDDIFKKYALVVPLDVKNSLDTTQTYAIFAHVYLLSPISVRQFLDELEKRVEDAVWEKIKKAQEK